MMKFRRVVTILIIILFLMSPGIIGLTLFSLVYKGVTEALIRSENFVVITATFCLTSMAAIITLMAILLALKGTHILRAYKKAFYLRYFMMIYGVAVFFLIINLALCGLYFIPSISNLVLPFVVALYFTNILHVGVVILMVSALAYNSLDSVER